MSYSEVILRYYGVVLITIGIPKISNLFSLKHPGHPGIPSNVSIVFPQELRNLFWGLNC